MQTTTLMAVFVHVVENLKQQIRKNSTLKINGHLGTLFQTTWLVL